MFFPLPMPSGLDLQAMMQAAYDQVEPRFPQNQGTLDTTGPVTIDGYSAYQKTYRVYSGEPAYELRDIWVQKDSEIFLVSIWSEYTNPEDFAEFQADANLLLVSLDIKSVTVSTDTSPIEILPTEVGGSQTRPPQAVLPQTPLPETNPRPQLLYVSHMEGGMEIFGLLEGGSQSMRLTKTDFDRNWNPAWSPDCSQIAFEADTTSGRMLIYTMLWDDILSTKLLLDPEIFYVGSQPSWSADGRKIAFSGRMQGDKTETIFLMNADGSQPVRLTQEHAPGLDYCPSWSA